MSVARRLLNERQVRERLFPGLPESAWLMLLDLWAHGPCGSTAVHGAYLPATTALRHLDRLAEICLIERQTSPSDRRINLVSLTANAVARLDQFAALVSGDQA